MGYIPNAATTDFTKTPSWTGPAINVGVIGGSGLYKLEGLEVVAELNPITVSAAFLSCPKKPKDVSR
jgi:purine nucleoside phosphorylase